MTLPMTVNKIKVEESEPILTKYGGTACGDMVSIRPCADKFEHKTFLGIFIGEIPLSFGASFDKESGELSIQRERYNPMIFIPEHNEVVFGCESWWGKIKSEDQLKQITDEDINNIWYVKALKQLADEAVKSKD